MRSIVFAAGFVNGRETMPATNDHDQNMRRSFFTAILKLSHGAPRAPA
jgi:hypothetical protein